MKQIGYHLKMMPLLTVLSIGLLPYQSLAELLSGSNQLSHYPETTLETLASPDTQPLLTASDLESFLKELEGFPPDWQLLHDQEGEEHGERLFKLNRLRDKSRIGHKLLKQRIAFVWSGILRQADQEFQGFRVALGPVLTKTSWGIIRFKPVNIPHDMIAIPPKKLFHDLEKKMTQGEEIDIDVLFTGVLISDESLMYAFSHENRDLGMILPFVQIDGVHYLFKPQ